MNRPANPNFAYGINAGMESGMIRARIRIEITGWQCCQSTETIAIANSSVNTT